MMNCSRVAALLSACVIVVSLSYGCDGDDDVPPGPGQGASAAGGHAAGGGGLGGSTGGGGVGGMADHEVALFDTLEWEITNDDHDGNPFDVVATVTFAHGASGETRATQMFYDGVDLWKYRFTGTRLGRWSYSTASDDDDLSGQVGTIDVVEQPDSNRRGFVSHAGNQLTVQVGDDEVEGFILTVYMNQRESTYAFRGGSPADFAAFAEETRDHGCNALFAGIVANAWFSFPALTHSEHDSEDPDPETFVKLEQMIAAARERGMHVHIWAWGDEQREWTMLGVGDGQNGIADKRLQRYIAARLGPLPGWTMGYGFDLHEWAAPSGAAPLNEWVSYLQQHFGWPHLLSARGYALEGPGAMNSYDGFGRPVPLACTDHGPADLDEVLEDMAGDLTRPHVYEERHTYQRPGFDLDMAGTRRMMWWETMAGGMGGWFGFYAESSGAYGGWPYPEPEQLQTHYQFWRDHHRFVTGMQSDSAITSGYCLRSGTSQYVFYQEDTSAVQMDLSAAAGPLSAVAVDAALPYAEIDLGTLAAEDQAWSAPYASDWSIAVGDFQ